jgi:hypothetical protein
LCLHGLKFETGLAPGKVKHFDGMGVIFIFLPRELVEAGQANHFVLKFQRHNVTPEFI